MKEQNPLLIKREIYGKDGTIGIPSFVFDIYPARVGIYIAILKMDSFFQPMYPDLYHIYYHELINDSYVSQETIKGRVFQIHPNRLPRTPRKDILEVLNGEVIFKKSFPMDLFKRID